MTEQVVDLGRDRIQIAKDSEKSVEFYSKPLIDSLLFHLEVKDSSNMRDKVIVQLLLYSGIRVSEFVNFSSAGKGKDKKSKQGNRALHGILYFLAVQQVQVSKTTKVPRNEDFYNYY